MRWYRLALIFVSVSFYTAMAPFGYALFALWSLFPTRDRWHRARQVQGIVRRAFGLFHDWARFSGIVDFNHRGLAQQLPDGPCIVVANHPTLTDTTAMVASVPNLCLSVRHDVYKKGFLRPLLAQAGHFDAGPENPLGSGSMLESIVARVRDGFRVLIFPEGTRSPPQGVYRFGRSAFEAACEAGVPLVAVLIREQPTYLAKGSGLFGPPAALAVKRLEVLKILDPADFFGDSRRLRDYVEGLYREAFGVERPSGSRSVSNRGRESKVVGE